MTPREFVDQELKLIKLMFDDLKALDPMVVLVKDNRRTAVEAAFHSDIHKDIVSQGIKDLVKVSNPDVVVFIAEAWAVSVKEYTPETPRPAKHKNRMEIIAVEIEFKTGEKYSCQAKILRDKGEVRLDKFDVSAGGISMGRFVDFFPVKNVN